MALRHLLLLLLLCLALLLAGCISSTPNTTPTNASDTDSPPFIQNNDTAPNHPPPTNDTPQDWFWINTTASPDATLTAFNWTVPNHAVVPHATYSGVDNVVLDIIPFLNGANKTQIDWSLIVFNLEAPNAELTARHIAVPYHHTEYTPAGATETIDDPGLTPIRLHTGPADIAPGDTLGFVLAAQGPKTAELGLALQVLTEDPGGPHVYLLNDTSQRRTQAQNAPLTVLPPTGTGTGFHYAYYFEHNQPNQPTTTTTTPDIQIHRGPAAANTPIASLRNTTLTSTFQTPQGWGQLWAGLGGPASTGTWTLDAHLHNQTLTQSGLHAGNETFFLEGDGPGDANISLTVQAAGLHLPEVLRFDHLSLGTGPSELFGLSGRNLAHGSEQAPLPTTPDGSRGIERSVAS